LQLWEKIVIQSENGIIIFICIGRNSNTIQEDIIHSVLEGKGRIRDTSDDDEDDNEDVCEEGL
jgi:hypothetical protein